jgi:PAS domain S-box-containing protein
MESVAALQPTRAVRRRPGVRRLARTAKRAALYWLVAAVLIFSAVALHEREDQALGLRPLHARGMQPRGATLLFVLLAASGLGAIPFARAAEGRREAEAQSRRHLELLHLVSDNVPSPIYLKAPDGRYLLCNLAFERLVGRPRDAIVGHNVDELLPRAEADRHGAVDQDLLRGGATRQYECRADLPDGPRDLLVVKAAVRDEEAVVGITAAIVDITEIRTREREQRRTLETLRKAKEEAEAGTRAKSDFLAVMSHEMRTPLNAVLGATDLLLDGGLSREQREQAEMARTAGRALLELIDDILDFSRVEAGRVDLERIPFDPRRLVRDTVAFVAGPAREKGLALSCQVSSEVPRHVAGDPGRLRQVLLNLLSNAIKFTERGGIDVALELESREVDEVVLRLRVRDSGVGIAPDLVPRLFEPFTQGETSTSRRHGGTGLGLAIARRLVGLMGGAIGVASLPGQGSEFSCTVRLGEATGIECPEPDDAPAPAPAGTPLPRRRVLLAEDNLTNQRVTRAQLERLGCVVDVAGDGNEAVRAAAARRYDVVLMDCQMPGLDGFGATREIRRREGDGPRVPIVALTANALRGDRERCLAAGMSDYLAKPADLRSLAAALGRLAPVAQAARPPTPTPPPASRLVDVAALASLRSIEETQPGFLAILVREFDQGFRDRLVDMQAALREGDTASLRSAAHSLKGAARILGALGMADLCRNIEAFADEQASGRIAEALSRLEREHEALMPALREAAAPS